MLLIYNQENAAVLLTFDQPSPARCFMRNILYKNPIPCELVVFGKFKCLLFNFPVFSDLGLHFWPGDPQWIPVRDVVLLR